MNDTADLLDFIRNFDQRNIRFAILGTPVRSGSMLFHSLLDEHPEILHLPIPFWYFFDWEYALKDSSPQTLMQDLLSKSKLFSTSIPELGENRDVTIELRMDRIAQVADALMPELGPMTRKTFILLLHAAYAKVYDIDLSKIKVVLQHNHYLPNLFGYLCYLLLRERYVNIEELQAILQLHVGSYSPQQDFILQSILEDFPNLSLLITVRNPYAALVSGKKYMENLKEPEWMHDEDLSCVYNTLHATLMNIYNVVALRNQLGDKVKLIKFEDVHGRTENTMRDLASYLGIAYQPSMLQSTFCGQLWSGGGISEKVRFGTDPDIPKKDERWADALDEATKTFLMAFVGPAAGALGYPDLSTTVAYPDSAPYLPYEWETYRYYPDFVQAQLASVIGMFRDEIPENQGLPAHRGQQFSFFLEKFNQQMLFWLRYPEIRQLSLSHLKINRQVLARTAPVA